MVTHMRGMSLNCRNKTAIADIPYPSRHWSRRLPALIKFIKYCAPSVLGVQETRDDMAVDLVNGLGAHWNFWGKGTSKIIWDHNKWNVLDQWEGGLPYKNALGVTAYRPITMIKLQSLIANESCWFVSTHFCVHVPSEATQRLAQAREVVRLINLHTTGPVVIFGDFNDVQYDSTAVGVRKIFAAAGLIDLRHRLSDAAMHGDSIATFNGWKITKRNGRWIDDVLTRDCKPYYGAVRLTDDTTPDLPVFATDHNGVFLKIEFGS